MSGEGTRDPTLTLSLNLFDPEQVTFLLCPLRFLVSKTGEFVSEILLALSSCLVLWLVPGATTSCNPPSSPLAWGFCS